MATERKKVVFITNNFAIGGVERVVLDLATRLVDGHKVYVVTVLGGGPMEEEFEKHGILVDFVGPRRVGLTTLPFKLYWILVAPISFVKLVWFLLHTRPQVVVTSLFLADILGITAAWVTRVPRRVVIQHDVHKLSAPAMFLKRAFSFLLTTHVVAISQTVRMFLQNVWKVSSKKITVIYNGVDFERLQDGRKERGNEIVLGFLGRLESIKGPQYFLQAMAQLKNADIQPPGIVAGDGSMRMVLEEQAVHNDLTNIKFRGGVPVATEALRDIDVLVVPSQEEGLGLVILEGLFAGKVVVASDIPAFREMIHHGRNGLLFPIGDVHALAEVLKKLIEDPAIVSKFKKEVNSWAYENQKRFDLGHTAVAYKKVFGL